jgi:hypothetical protein
MEETRVVNEGKGLEGLSREVYESLVRSGFDCVQKRNAVNELQSKAAIAVVKLDEFMDGGKIRVREKREGRKLVSKGLLGVPYQQLYGDQAVSVKPVRT